MIQTKYVSREELTRDAIRAALKVRNTHHLGLRDPICVYDVAEEMGIEVRFVDGLPSMEGLHVEAARPHILLSSLRPAGRQAFTCAHELGHHVFGHGGQIDTHALAESLSDSHSMEPEEFLANQFAAFLLMPKTTVLYAFTRRGWNPTAGRPLQFYTIAGWLGVGYTSLIHHMRGNLGLLPWSVAHDLAKLPPSRLRAQFLGRAEDNHLIIADSQWSSRAIDAHVDDVIALPAGTMCENKGNVALVEQDNGKWLYRAATPGIERLYQPNNGWAAFVRVSRRNYAGRSIFRHLEDSDDDG